MSGTLKHGIILAASLLFVADALAVAVHVHRTYVHQATIQATQAANDQQREVGAYQSRITADEQQLGKQSETINQLHMACLYGVDAYNALPYTQRIRLTRPVCTIQ